MAKRGPKQLPRAQRFARHVRRDEGCHVWTGPVAKRRGGYGVFYDDDGRLRRAHRVAWEIETGETLTEDEVIRHRECDNPPCVRFDHLRRGTQADNLDDMREKGRDNVCGGQWERGTERYNAKLDEAKVRWVRSSTLSSADAAAALGVSSALVRMVRRRKAWAHVA